MVTDALVKVAGGVNLCHPAQKKKEEEEEGVEAMKRESSANGQAATNALGGREKGILKDTNQSVIQIQDDSDSSLHEAQLQVHAETIRGGKSRSALYTKLQAISQGEYQALLHAQSKNNRE